MIIQTFLAALVGLSSAAIIPINWSSSFGLHIEPREIFVDDIAGPITRPPNYTGHIIPRDNKDSEVKDVVQNLMRLPNDTGHIIPKGHKEDQEQLQNIRNTPCGVTTLSDGDTQIITSMNYPGDYPNNHQCTWEIQAGSADTDLIFTCEEFVVQGSKECRKDYLQLQDGKNINKKFCGTNTPGSVTSNTGSLIVAFSTDRRKTEKGFKCTVTAEGTTTSTAPSTSSSTTTTTTTTGGSQCSCGRVNRISRIVGGEPTEVNEYPWQVGVVTNTSTSPFCGASIIANECVVVAAHCVIGVSPGSIRLVVGEHNYTQTGETDATQQLTISQIIVHPGYNSRTLDNDIALLKLSEPLEFMSDNKVAPVCLPDATANYDNVDAIVTGWGTLSLGGSQPSVLHEVTVPTMTNAACINTDYKRKEITANMICAGSGGKDSCQGDSGGPMVTQDSTNTMVQIGIVSWGYGCAAPNYPGVYTRVTQYLDWIASNTGGSQTCPPATS